MSVLTGMKWKATATASRPADIPQTVANEETSTSDGIHTHHVDPGHDKVDASNNEADCDWVGEANESEECRGVVHQRC